MLNKRIKFLGLLILVFSLAITMVGCDIGDGPTDEIREDTYTVSGQVVDVDGEGVEGVTLHFSEGFGKAKTDENGKWSKSGLEDEIKIIPSKEDALVFEPEQIMVRDENNSVAFQLILTEKGLEELEDTIEKIDQRIEDRFDSEEAEKSLEEIAETIRDFKGIEGAVVDGKGLNVKLENGGVMGWLSYDSNLRTLKTSEELYDSELDIMKNNNLVHIANKSLPGNNRAVIINPMSGGDETRDRIIKPFLDSIEYILDSAGYRVDRYSGKEADLDIFKELDRYGLIVFEGHGGFKGNIPSTNIMPKILWQTGKKDKGITPVFRDWFRDRIRMYHVDWKGGRQSFYWITNSFIEHYTSGYEDSVVVSTGCQTLKESLMAEAFVNKGAQVYLGWDEVTCATRIRGKSLLIGHMSAGYSLKEAMDLLPPEEKEANIFGEKARLKYYPTSGGEAMLAKKSDEEDTPEQAEDDVYEVVDAFLETYNTGNEDFLYPYLASEIEYFIYLFDKESPKTSEIYTRDEYLLNKVLEYVKKWDDYELLFVNPKFFIEENTAVVETDILEKKGGEVREGKKVIHLKRKVSGMWNIYKVMRFIPSKALTIDVEGNGTTTPEKGPHTYNEGETVNISASPDEGWEFSHWEGDVVDTDSAETSVIMDEDKTVTAHFVEEDNGDEIVEFEDPVLEEDIREIINKPEGDIYLDDVLDIEVLSTDGHYAGDRMVESFEGIQNLKNLEKLTFFGYEINDLSPIAELSNLKTLSFGGWEPTRIEDISPIGNLTNLENLYIRANGASDISAIGNLVNLKKMVLWRSVVDGDISFLANLENLEHLDLHSNTIKDISVLANLTNLEYLDIGSNNVEDISPIKNLTNLKTLKMGGAPESIPSGGNKFDDLTPIENLTDLEILTLHYSNVSDISILENFINLKELNFRYAKVSDISPLVENDGFGAGDTIDMRWNVLDLTPGSDDMQNINTLIDRGVNVEYEPQN